MNKSIWFWSKLPFASKTDVYFYKFTLVTVSWQFQLFLEGLLVPEPGTGSTPSSWSRSWHQRGGANLPKVLQMWQTLSHNDNHTYIQLYINFHMKRCYLKTVSTGILIVLHPLIHKNSEKLFIFTKYAKIHHMHIFTGQVWLRPCRLGVDPLQDCLPLLNR
jgi:hypothetical protein